jgi:hypothetical protein
LEKLDSILNMFSSIPPDQFGDPDLSYLTKDALSYYHKTLKPVSFCFENHFGSDKQLFFEKYPKMRFSSFYEKCSAAGRDLPHCIPKSDRLWTENELSALKTGVEIYGRRYDRIKSHFKSEFKDRSVTALKAKVRNLVKRGDVDLPAAVREVRNLRWTEEELSALKTGVQLYGSKFDVIKSHFQSEFKNRTVNALGLKARRLMKRVSKSHK